MLVLIIGENGSGKTFFMTICALSQPDKNILANFTIKHPKFKLLEFDNFLNIETNTDVFIDEAYTWLENRRSSKATNVYISEIKEQKRKSDSTWYVSEQRPNMIDKRFENYPNVLVECKPRFPIGHSLDDFVYKITYESPQQVVYKRFPYVEARNYFKFFNTNQKVEPENKQKIEFEIIKQNPDKLMSKVLELVNIIEKDGSITEYTHPSLKWCCLKNNIILDYEPFLYLYFKNKIKIEKSKNKESV